MQSTITIAGIGSLHAHSLMVGLAVVLAASLGIRSAVRNAELPLRSVLAAVVLIALAVFVGGRLHFALPRLHLFAYDPLHVLRLTSGGLHAPGAICGAVVGGWVSLRALGLPVARFADAFAPSVGVGIAVARLGCFLNGCCFGLVCELPWGLEMPVGSLPYREQIEKGILPRGAARSLPVHALPLYFSGVAWAIAAFTSRLQSRKSYDGQVALWMLFLFSASSAALEPLRHEHAMRIYLGPWPQLQWVTLAMSLLSCGALLARSRASGGRRSSPQISSPPS
ncbi:MAG: prolipoprotein diacylglyceryl transferase [Candidatus Binatia bacterium]|nr:prolipoprotein diacylglyceryl transferase [Candidatus Binatia bacterium]